MSKINEGEQVIRELRDAASLLNDTASTTDFYTGLFTVGFEKRKLKNGNYIVGIRIKSDFIED